MRSRNSAILCITPLSSKSEQKKQAASMFTPTTEKINEAWRATRAATLLWGRPAEKGTWHEAVPLLGGGPVVQLPNAWLRKRQRPAPRASREFFWVQNAGQHEEHRVKCWPSRVCEAAEARQNR